MSKEVYNNTVIDVWYHGRRYEVPRGLAPGWGLRIFFDVNDNHDLFVIDSSSSVRNKIDPMSKYFVSHWEHFYSISKKVIGFRKEGPRAVHVKSGEKFDIFVDVPSKWAPSSRDILKDLTKYEVWLKEQPGLVEAAKRELRGKVLGAWHCPEPGFTDVLLSLANGD